MPGTKFFLSALALLATGCTQTVKVRVPEPVSASDPFAEVTAEFTRGCPHAALQLLDAAPDPVRNDARGLYLSGYAWLRLHLPAQAKPCLERALSGGFNGYPGWESTAALLGRIAEIERLRPAACIDSEPKGLRIYADDAPWINAVVGESPEFVRRAQKVFGPDLPTIDVYLFRSRDAYARFYRALFGVNVSTWWQNGTGDSNVVVFCQEDCYGKPLGPPGGKRGLGDVLHEYAHALMNTLHGDGYLRKVPQWLDEGLSDFIARAYYDELFETSATAIRKAVARGQMPTDEELARRLYQRDSFLRYSVARYMVDEMMKGREPKVIPELLRRAAKDGDFDAAIRETTGLTPRELRERVIARFR